MEHEKGKSSFILGFCVCICICILYGIVLAYNQKRRPHAMYVSRRVVYNPHTTLEEKSSSHESIPREQLRKARDNPILKAAEQKTRSAFQIGSR